MQHKTLLFFIKKLKFSPSGDSSQLLLIVYYCR
uniref:Uncharacterized protein n=1 Tax=Arundo donax TaxID=35708 RepID=A0A0A9B4N8_ARUDO